MYNHLLIVACCYNCSLSSTISEIITLLKSVTACDFDDAFILPVKLNIQVMLAF